ncbi:type ISP restriction/modification enzyme, partial [Mobiluncus mulieris]|nr:damage-inducible protein [Mobiluncus mulieris]
EQGIDEGYVEFPGITLTDTFQLAERQNQIPCIGDFQANLKRVQAQRAAKIQVVVMNPPYSAGQDSANDNNQNLNYPSLDGRIADTYAARSSATNKNSLYDSYYRALRWASDRIKDEGIIAFVSNSSFIDGNTADGVRLTWAKEFSEIYIYNLKGNQRTQGERSRQEGGKIFGSGSRTGVAITVLVKKPHTDTARKRSARIHYAEVDDYLTAQEKLDVLSDETSITGTDQRGKFEAITPNSHGDWLNQRDDKYLEYQSLGEKKTKSKDYGQAIFRQYSGGLKTNRDPWCYNYSHQAVSANMRRMIENYNSEVAAGHNREQANSNPTWVSWGGNLDNDLNKGKRHHFCRSVVQKSIYRPFCKQNVYFERAMNERVYQLPRIFPT